MARRPEPGRVEPGMSVDLETALGLPEEPPWEVSHGFLEVREPPGAYHGSVVTNLAVTLGRFIQAHDSGVLLTGDPGFVLQERPLLLRGPDLAFVRKERIPPGGLPDTFSQGAPDLAVEVLSPSDTVRALLGRAREYIEAGAQAVWLVDPRRPTVHVIRPGGERTTLAGDDVLDGRPILPGFRVPVRELLGFR